MLRSYWIWLILLTVAWAGVWHEDPEIPHSPGRVLGIALSYAFYFLCPLFRRQAVLFACLLVLASLSAAYAFSPVFHHANSPALYGLLVLTLLAGYAAYHLPLLHAVGAGLAMLAAAFVSLRGSGGRAAIVFASVRRSCLPRVFRFPNGAE